MIKEITEEVWVDDGSRGLRLVGEPPFDLVESGGKRFWFHFCRKSTTMGEWPVDQWWMRQQGLYGERNQESPNREAIIGYFWALSMKHLTIGDEPVQESYILARLLPHARSNGSRRVFEDASLTRAEKLGDSRRAILEKLEQSLKTSCHEEVDEVAFRDRTANVLGPPEYDSDVWDCYHRFETEVLGEAKAELQKDCINGGNIAVERWSEKMRSIGRRRGHQLEKQVLDILSYEARAAFHRCYAAVWWDLIPFLGNKYGLSDESLMFHRLWHLVLQRKAKETLSAKFYPFHGHIFGLHPACGIFMLTESGPALVGQWLADPGSVTKYQRLLHGLLVAIHQYADRNQVYALLRKKEGIVETVADMAALEEQLFEERTGRRRHKRRKTDAC